MNKRGTLLMGGAVLLLLASVAGYFLWKHGGGAAPPPTPTANPTPSPTPNPVATNAPLLTEIEPGDGGDVQGAEAWIRWSDPTALRGRVLWRKSGETDFRTADAAGGDPWLARLAGLEPGQAYEYHVETEGEGPARRSTLRTFTVRGGLFLEPADEQTIRRDYDQTVKLTLHNASDKKVVVAAKALARFDDLLADVVGPGSVDEPADLAAGGKLELRLAVTASDATRESYDLPVEAAGAFAVVKVRIALPEFKLVFNVVGEDPRTLAKTIEVRNEGATLADLGVDVAGPNQRDVRLDPAARHAYLAAGQALQFTATPVLYLEFTSLKAELECVAAGQGARFPLEFRAPAGKRLIGVRAGSAQTTSGADWYCTNKPTTCGDVPGPQGNGPAPAVAEPPVLPRPGSCKIKGKSEDCWKHPEGLHCIDPKADTGMGEGQGDSKRYDTEQEAAVAALQFTNPISVKLCKEFSGLIIQDAEGKFYWTMECEGNSWCVAQHLCPPRFTCTGVWHTHSCPEKDAQGRPLKDDPSERFSPEDVDDNSWTHNEYLGTPGGQILVYPIKEGAKNESGGSGPSTVVKDPKGNPITAPPNKPRPSGSKRSEATQPGGETAAPRREGQPPAAPHLRPGLLEALQRRATFSRAHRGPFAGPVEGDADDSSAMAAAYHADDRVCFAWRQNGQVVFTAFDANGELSAEPRAIGEGRWPRLAADGKRTAAAWRQGEGFAVRQFDGDQWSDVVALPGKEAALAFAPGGALYAATSTGLWKLGDKDFERVAETAFAQPALAVDGQGRPHVAWRQDGKVFCDGAAVGDGERPTLASAADGTIHLAYLSKGALVRRSRQGDAWTAAQTTPARNPSWPALARDGDGVRLTYLGPADRGPDALWLIRPSDERPILLPSLAGNVTESGLLVDFGLRSERWFYRPHDLDLFVNDVRVGEFQDAIPEGRYLFPLNPYQIFTSAGEPAVNRVSIRSRHVNGGHYAVSSNYQLITRTAWSEWFAFAADEAEVSRAAASPSVNHDRPDLAVLANGLSLPTQAPETDGVDFPVTVANLGEAASRPARLAMLSGETVLARVEAPSLQPGQQSVVTMRLDGRLESVVFRIEQDQPDFNPTNDALTIHLWSKPAVASAKPPKATVVQAPVDVAPAWAAGGLPAGARAIGDWNWHDQPAYAGGRSHAGTPGEGPSLHYFIRAKQPLILGPGDSLVQYVHLDPKALPRQVLLQLYVEGDQGERRVYWGDDLINLGGDGSPMGPLPVAGQWVRLSVPVERFGLKEARVTGVLFGQYDGRAFWGPTTKALGVPNNPPDGHGAGIKRN